LLNVQKLPPDPYADGPYTNRILGPVDRIDSVKKRKAGLMFKNSIKLEFEYVGRPIGGINPKAALLDIMSNFLVIGSASAVFWGGQHRFVSKPFIYPFTGGGKGISQLYRGNPIGWATTTAENFGNNLASGTKGIAELAKGFFSKTTGKGFSDILGELRNLFTGNNVASNLVKEKIAKSVAGQIPYLSGLKALLIGEPVGEWHVTIGNPFNPIAMIGNLICTGIDVEFSEELGPDDFPVSMKFTVNLEHGMARDRDAIQSMFNRGMGRIYQLPDDFKLSSNNVTEVDKYTKKVNVTGSPIGGTDNWLGGAGTTGRKFGQPSIKELSNGGSISVWNRAKFDVISSDVPLSTDFRSTYKSLTWVAKKALE
jgi:hypothetical protein